MEAVMILNTKKISKELQKRFGDIYPVKLPFKNESIGDHLLQFYSDKDFIFLVSNQDQAPDGNTGIVKKDAHSYEIYLNDEESSTLLKVSTNALKRIRSLLTEEFSLTINFGDTIIEEPVKDVPKNYLMTGVKEQLAPWTSVRREDKALIFSNKNDESKNKKGEVVAGVFVFENGEQFYQACKATSKQEKKAINDDSLSFYQAVNDYNQNYEQLLLVHTNSWLDFGHEKEYLETKKLVQARFFNSIAIDDQRGILTKMSEDTKKLIHEIEWYIKMPEELQFFTPRIYNYSLDKLQPCVEMEYYPYETLHNLYIYGNLEISDWEKIMDKLMFVRQEMKLYSEHKQLSSKDLNDIYYQKTVERVERLMKDPAFEVFYKEVPTINGVVYRPVKELLDQLLRVLENNQLIGEKPATIIHGDFCLSNILFEVSNQLVKLIDPRGKFGSFDIYGDEFYDIAKIMHSFEGAYDHIITDQFNLEQESVMTYSYTFQKTDLQKEITELVNESIAQRYPINQIRLIEGLLFLSMIPLHKDYPKRQKVMFGQALKLLTPYFNESNRIERDEGNARNEVYR